MLGLTSGVRILLSAQPIDMRNSIDGLCAIVRNEWKENLFAGHLFVFVSKRGDRVRSEVVMGAFVTPGTGRH